MISNHNRPLVELVALRRVGPRLAGRSGIFTTLSFFATIALLFAIGCSSTSTAKKDDAKSPWKTVPAKTANKKSAKQATAVATPAPEAPAPAPNTRILPLNARIVSARADLRFVLIDFTNSRRPALEERLNVYRLGQKVAEIKISGPYLNTTVAADVLAGEAKYGDEVKAD